MSNKESIADISRSEGRAFSEKPVRVEEWSIWRALQQFVLENGREREAFSLWGSCCMPQARGRKQNPVFWAVVALWSNVLSDYLPLGKSIPVAAHMERASVLVPLSLNCCLTPMCLWKTQGCKNQDLSFSFIAFQDHKLESLGLLFCITANMLWFSPGIS